MKSSHRSALPSPPPRSRLFFLTFGSPINSLHSERWGPVFCGHVKPGKCRADLLWERLLMSLPFCSLIAHHQGRCPSDPRSPTRRCSKRPKTSRKDMYKNFLSVRSGRSMTQSWHFSESQKNIKHLFTRLGWLLCLSSSEMKPFGHMLFSVSVCRRNSFWSHFTC